MASLAEKLSDILGDVFEKQGLPRAYGLVRVSDRPDLAQFQCNGAMAAAKAAKTNPRELAQKLLEVLQNNVIFEKLEIAGPGFININVTDDYIAAHLAEIAADHKCGVAPRSTAETVVLDYGGPNVAKAMHVGHLRAAIIGDSLRRIMSFGGFKTLGDVHLGDWGTPMGMLLAFHEEHNPAAEYYAPDFNKTLPVGDVADAGIMAYLEETYPKAAQACKDDPEKMERARAATLALQDGTHKGYRYLWSLWRQVSIQNIRENYKALGVHFDLWKGEADVHSYIAPMVETLKAKNLAQESDGAWIVPVAVEDDKKEIPPLILYKRDGAVLYGTTDLATIIERVKLYNPSHIVYVVDQRQNLHFEQVFRVSRMAGFVSSETELTHAGFGTMNGTDGKPFKTRAGGVMKLEDLIQMALDKAMQRLNEADLAQDMPEAERQDIAHKVGIAAIKFADLQNTRTADYVFDLDRLTSFEGKTGPYMLYQVVRIKSLLRKAGFERAGTPAFNISEGDRTLALILAEFPDHFAAALRGYMPHILCEYAYNLAQAFSSFYSNCHILSETDDIIKQSRLALCAMTVRQLKIVLDLLGIETPERM